MSAPPAPKNPETLLSESIVDDRFAGLAAEGAEAGAVALPFLPEAELSARVLLPSDPEINSSLKGLNSHVLP